MGIEAIVEGVVIAVCVCGIVISAGSLLAWALHPES